jgi:DNA repair protein RecO (recombination protein O)
MEIPDSTKYALSHIESAQLEKLYTFNVSDEVLDELCKVTSLYRTRFIDRTLKSMEMLATFDDAL